MTYALSPTSDAPERPELTAGLTARAAIEDLRRRLVRYAVRLLWNRDDAEEVAQEAFGIAIEHGVTHAESRFGPWMFRTVGNLCLNRRRKRRYESLDKWIEHAGEDDPAEKAAQLERLTLLREAIEKLPDQQRIAIVLKTQQQMDYGDIARIMEISESAARGHVHLARRKLAELMPQE